MTARLAIGTAQFGMVYGIANQSGRPGLELVSAILSQAHEAGVEMLDTAIAYGDAEAVLGRAGIAGWNVVTKLPPVPDDIDDIEGWMEAQVTGSLSLLGIGQLHGLLLHAPGQMHGPRATTIAWSLGAMRGRGLTRRIGVSIQHPDLDLPAVLAHMTPDIIQSPFNLLDDRLVAQGWAARLRGIGCEVHARSTFLQGLLVMPPAARPAWCHRWGDLWRAWEDWLAGLDMPAFEACVRFVRAERDVDYAVIGVDNTQQMASILMAGSLPLPSRPRWPCSPPFDLISPSQWPPT